MRNTILVIVILLSAVLTGNSQEPESAATRNADTAWQKLQLTTMKAQQKVKVYLRNGTELKGTFDRIEGNGILLRIKNNKSTLISRKEILRITSHSWKKASWIGMAIGAGGGAALGYAKPPIHDAGASRSGNAFGVAVLGALAGFCAGAAVGSEQTLYSSPVADGSSEVRDRINLNIADVPAGEKGHVGSDNGRRQPSGP